MSAKSKQIPGHVLAASALSPPCLQVRLRTALEDSGVLGSPLLSSAAVRRLSGTVVAHTQGVTAGALSPVMGVKETRPPPHHRAAASTACCAQALSPEQPPQAPALPAAAAAAAARLASAPWTLHRRAMDALAHADGARPMAPAPARGAGAPGAPGSAGEDALPEAGARLPRANAAEAARRCARWQQRLAAAGDERLLAAWLPGGGAVAFLAAGGGGGAARAARGQLLQQVGRPAAACTRRRRRCLAHADV